MHSVSEGTTRGYPQTTNFAKVMKWWKEAVVYNHAKGSGEEKGRGKINSNKTKKDMQSITIGLCCSGVNTMYAMGYEINLTGCSL